MELNYFLNIVVYWAARATRRKSKQKKKKNNLRRAWLGVAFGGARGIVGLRIDGHVEYPIPPPPYHLHQSLSLSSVYTRRPKPTQLSIDMD